MIEELSVRNFALIDSLTLSFEDGFSVLTGETGAGKSIIVGSISFLLGAKADTDSIRSGCDEAGVSALLYIDSKNQDALSWLMERNIKADDSRIAVRRGIKSSGRGSIYIQNVPVTRNELAEFMSFLFDLHGQHNHESLLRKETHRVYLDKFAGLEEQVAAFNRVFMELAEKRKALEALNRSDQDREQRLEILNYAVEEISKAAPKKGEIKELEAETQRLGDFEKLSGHVHTAASSLFEGDGKIADGKVAETSLLALARRLKASLEHAAAVDGALSSFLKRVEDLYYEAEDLASEFRSYRDNLSYDPARLEEASERLALLYKLKKKYRPAGQRTESSDKATSASDEEEILIYKAEAEAEIEALGGAGENQDKLKAEIGVLEKDLAQKAQALSAKRSEGAKRLAKGITEILYRLGMPKAVFSVQISPKGEPGRLVLGPWGADEVEFMISANTGEPLKELARIASGGELSRVMLAIKTILCGIDHIETLIFDEIDTGIGGEVALSVGEYLSLIGKTKQIFCVTHLASIAVRADNHYKVEKKLVAGSVSADRERTVTEVQLLRTEERRQEIARMLAGDSGQAALAHADELLAKYGMGRL